jgi:hypothetical protein
VGGRHTFIIEAIDAVDRSTLVVAAQNEEVLWVFDFVSEEQADGLQRLLPPIDIVSAKGGRVSSGDHERNASPTQERDNSLREESHRIQTVGGDRSIAHAHRLQMIQTQHKVTNIPQILIGASSSSKTGWLVKTSLARIQSHLISFSERLTCRPGLAPRTERSCSIM